MSGYELEEKEEMVSRLLLASLSQHSQWPPGAALCQVRGDPGAGGGRGETMSCIPVLPSPQVTPSIILKYKTRRFAEAAMATGKHYKDRT